MPDQEKLGKQEADQNMEPRRIADILKSGGFSTEPTIERMVRRHGLDLNGIDEDVANQDTSEGS